MNGLPEASWSTCLYQGSHFLGPTLCSYPHVSTKLLARHLLLSWALAPRSLVRGCLRRCAPVALGLAMKSAYALYSDLTPGVPPHPHESAFALCFQQLRKRKQLLSPCVIPLGPALSLLLSLVPSVVTWLPSCKTAVSWMVLGSLQCKHAGLAPQVHSA